MYRQLSSEIPFTYSPSSTRPLELTFRNSWKNHFPLNLTFITLGASLVAQLIKNPPAMRETQVQFLGQEDPLEKG